MEPHRHDPAAILASTHHFEATLKSPNSWPNTVATSVSTAPSCPPPPCLPAWPAVPPWGSVWPGPRPCELKNGQISWQFVQKGVEMLLLLLKGSMILRRPIWGKFSPETWAMLWCCVAPELDWSGVRLWGWWCWLRQDGGGGTVSCEERLRECCRSWPERDPATRLGNWKKLKVTYANF